jgi:hypothetical protein
MRCVDCFYFSIFFFCQLKILADFLNPCGFFNFGANKGDLTPQCNASLCEMRDVKDVERLPLLIVSVVLGLLLFYFFTTGVFSEIETVR